MSSSEYNLTPMGDVNSLYDEKIKLIDNIDPYTLGVETGELSADLSILPCVSVINMVNYLVLTHSFYTDQQLKAYKSLQAYKYYEAGFVQEVCARKINSNVFIVMGKYPTPAVDPDPKAAADQKPGTLPNRELDFPSKDLLMRLLEVQPHRRLRSVRTLETIAFYKGFSFKDVRDKKIRPNDLLRLYFPNGPRNNEEDIECFQDFDD